MFFTDECSTTAIPARNVDSRSLILLRSYPEVENFLLKKFVTDQAIGQFNATVLPYMQPFNMTPLQNTDDVVAKSCRAADI